MKQAVIGRTARRICEFRGEAPQRLILHLTS